MATAILYLWLTAQPLTTPLVIVDQPRQLRLNLRPIVVQQAIPYTPAVIIEQTPRMTAVPYVVPDLRRQFYQYPQTYQYRGGTYYRRDCSSGRCRWVPVR